LVAEEIDFSDIDIAKKSTSIRSINTQELWKKARALKGVRSSRVELKYKLAIK
jgi:hypothetical protein